MSSSPTLQIGPTRLRVLPENHFGVVRGGPADVEPGVASPYLDDILSSASGRAAFFDLIDRSGLVVCQNLDIDPTPYRRVRGRRGHGRMSQAEHFHHDGCSSPTKPRVVEIRCPDQHWARTVPTAVAPFPQVVRQMLYALPSLLLRAGDLAHTRDALRAGEPFEGDWDTVQGIVNRTIRQLSAESGRAYFRDVDQAVKSYAHPWTLRESRFIANDNAIQTAQHRRALGTHWEEGAPNGHLLKRWPAEELPPLD